MGSLQFNLAGFCSPTSAISSSNHHYRRRRIQQLSSVPNWVFSQSRGSSKLDKLKIRCIKLDTTVPTTTTTTPDEQKGQDEKEEAPSIDFAFVNSRLLPDGTPDVQIRSSCGGQKLRNIMLDSNIDLYGPYDRFLLNCGGGGTCRTCIVEVVEGKELLSLRTDKEKEALKKKPKTWRLACQTTVGEKDSRGQVVIQQLPEWKSHEWRK